MAIFSKRSSFLGFTAIEIAMVATVIAILALIVLPLFRKRTEESKIVAARDDLRSLRDSLVLANAYTDQWFRLQDLDNTQSYNEPPTDPDLEVPIAVWNRPLSITERRALAQAERWTGPYVSVSRFAFIQDLISPDGRPELFHIVTSRSPDAQAAGGPILLISAADGDDFANDRMPVDPWGNPYIFFGPGKLQSNTYAETEYSDAVIYSLGPNGLPGLSPGTNPRDYLRESGNLGAPTSDDLYVKF